MVAHDEDAVLAKGNFVYIFAVFLEDKDLMCLGFGFEERFEACFVLGDAWVWLALQGFFENYLPCVHVSSYVIEGAAVDLDVNGWILRTVQDGVEGYVSA